MNESIVRIQSVYMGGCSNAPSRYIAIHPNTAFSGRIERQQGKGEDIRYGWTEPSDSDRPPEPLVIACARLTLP